MESLPPPLNGHTELTPADDEPEDNTDALNRVSDGWQLSTVGGTDLTRRGAAACWCWPPGPGRSCGSSTRARSPPSSAPTATARWWSLARARLLFGILKKSKLSPNINFHFTSCQNMNKGCKVFISLKIFTKTMKFLSPNINFRFTRCQNTNK